MSIINNGLLLASGADAAVGYQISRSLRFNSADSAYLSRTPGSAGNRRTFTFACWVKRVKDDASPVNIFAAGANNFRIAFGVGTTAYLQVYDYNGSSYNFNKGSAASYRDFSAWYHIVVAIDTTNATADDRVKMYVNGSRITDLYTGTNINPSQNLDTYVNSTSNAHYIGYLGSSGLYLDAYLADVHFIDGQALDPSSFTETSATTGQLIPKAYTGSYGTNGFRLTFSDNSGTTSTTLGKDAAGSNNWSPNNFSVASGSGNDSLVDSPTSYGTDTGAGGEVRGNYCTLNPLVNISGHTFRNGNLEAVTSSSNYGTFVSTIAMPPSGKWYAEAYISATSGYPLVGIAGTGCTFGTTSYLGGQATMYAYYGVNGNKYNNGTSSSYGATYTTGDTIGIAYDADAGTITFYKNGVSQGQAYSGITSGSYYFAGNEFNSASGTQIWNFGARAFSYQAPSGFKALCDTNLTAPVIAKPNTVMDVVLYSGTGSSQTVTGLNFNPDFVWLKRRSSAQAHYLYDVIRGTSSVLYSDGTDAEQSISTGLTSFNSNGFSLGSLSGVNASSTTNVAWAWDAGSSTVTNTAGSITSSVRANASAGFSIVTYTANAPNNTIGHGLNTAPAFVVVKNRSRADNWYVYHSALGVSNWFNLNTTSAATSSTNYWGTTGNWTSTTFGVNTNGTAGNNYGNDSMVAYCFAPVAGFSTAFSYSGTGSTDGPFCFLGFRPRLILLKVSNTTGPWYLFDTARNTYNVMNNRLEANSSSTEASDRNVIDALSNGFKLRDVDAVWNQSGNTYIGFAWAESPFQYARAR